MNIEIFNDLSDWNYTLKMKLRLPLGGFVRTADSFGNKQVPASQCAHYPLYLPQIVLKITNITFRVDTMHIGTQAVTVFMDE